MLFSDGISFSSTFLKFVLGIGFGVTIFSSNLFPLNSPVASAVLWTNFLEANLAPSSLVFEAVFNRFFFHICWIDFLNDKNSYPLTYSYYS